MKRLLAVVATAVLFCFANAPGAKAGSDGVILGSLTCKKTGEGKTYLFFSRVPVECTYDGDNGPAKYTGTSGILLGVDLEVEKMQDFAFLVLGGSTSEKAGVEGQYVGAKASVTPGIGIALQAGLIGVGRGVSLVPIGAGAQEGYGLTAGLAYLDIQ